VNLLSDEIGRQEQQLHVNGTSLKLPSCYKGKMTFCAFGYLYSACICTRETDLLPVTLIPVKNRACKNFLKFFSQDFQNLLLWCVFGL